jgi:hypothetical protein
MSTPVYMRDGRPLTLGGYCLPFARPSAPLAELDGRREVFIGASVFDPLLARRRRGEAHLSIKMLDHSGEWTLCNTLSAHVDLWADEYGLAFQISHLKVGSMADGWIDSVCRGRFPEASIYGRWSHKRTPRADGSMAVSRVDSIEHISLCRPEESAYGGGTFVHVAGQHQDPGPAHALAARWERSRRYTLKAAGAADPRPRR